MINESINISNDVVMIMILRMIMMILMIMNKLMMKWWRIILIDE